MQAGVRSLLLLYWKDSRYTISFLPVHLDHQLSSEITRKIILRLCASGNKIDVTTYAAQHRPHCPNCPFLPTEQAQSHINQILWRSRYPLISWGGPEEETSLEVSGSSGNPVYPAISYVYLHLATPKKVSYLPTLQRQMGSAIPRRTPFPVIRQNTSRHWSTSF